MMRLATCQKSKVATMPRQKPEISKLTNYGSKTKQFTVNFYTKAFWHDAPCNMPEEQGRNHAAAEA